MMFRRRVKVISLLSFLILVSVAVGFFLGIIVSSVVNKKKETPKFWREAAMKQLVKLKPTEAQRKAFEAPVDEAVKDLTELRKQAIHDVWQIVDRALVKIEKELTPQQREQFEKIKPRNKPRNKPAGDR